jgi:hypothetical protein
MNPKWTVGGLVMVFVILGGCAVSFARPQGGLIPVQKERCEDKFLSLDADKDGKVSFEEFQAISNKPDGPVEKTFRSRDVNGDGFLTQGELCARHGSQKPRKTEETKPAGQQ